MTANTILDKKELLKQVRVRELKVGDLVLA